MGDGAENQNNCCVIVKNVENFDNRTIIIMNTTDKVLTYVMIYFFGPLLP